MKSVLIVSNIYTNPVVSGSCKCILDYRALLESLGVTTYLLYIGKDEEAKRVEMEKAWNGRVFYYHFNWFEAAFHHKYRKLYHIVTGKYPTDYFICFRLNQFVRKLESNYNFTLAIINYPWISFVSNYFKKTRTAIFTHDCFSNKSERIGIDMYSLTPSQESRILKRFDNILAIQSLEAVVFKYLAPNTPCYTVYSSAPYVCTDYVGNKRLLYIAADNKLNYDGITYFIDNIFVRLKTFIPEIELNVAGKICNSLKKYVGYEGVNLVGYVDSFTSFYSSADIAINPTRRGSGLKIKTVEGISYGKIMLTSTHSSEGIYDNGDLPLFVADSFEDYFSILSKLWSDKDYLLQMKNKCAVYIDDMNKYIANTYTQLIKDNTI